MPSPRRPERLPLLVATALLAAAVLAGTACATGGSGDGEDQAAGTLRIQVHNRNFEAVTIFGEAPGGRTRVGTVGSNDSRVFSIPWTSPDDIRFVLRLDSGFSCRSRIRYVGPGETVTLTVAADFGRSPACRGA